MLISGATGKVGQHLIKSLQIKGVPFKALARTETAARKLAKQDVDTMRGDLSDPAAIEAALVGADTFFLLGTPSAHQGKQELGAIQAAKAAGVRRVVKLSASGAGVDSACSITREHARVEQTLANSDLAWTSLRPNLFMQNWVANNATDIQAAQPVYTNAADARIAWIDTRDVAEAAAEVLTSSGHDGRIYELTGPEALTYAEAAEKLSTLLNREIPIISVSDATAYQAMIGTGMDPWYAYALTTLIQSYRKGHAETPLGTIELLTGHASHSIDSFFKDNLDAFTA